MKFIEEKLKQSYKYENKAMKKWTILLFFIFYGSIFKLLSIMIEEILIIDIIMLVIFSLIIYTLFIIPRIKIKNFNLKNTRLYKILETKGYVEEFYNTIDYELDDKISLKYFNEVYKVGLVVTKTWFIFISYRSPIIEKKEKISRIGSVGSTEDGIIIELKNNKLFRLHGIDYFDIEKDMKSLFKNIFIDYNTFEDE